MAAEKVMRQIFTTLDLPFVVNLPDGGYRCRIGGEDAVVDLLLTTRLTGDPERDQAVQITPVTGEVTWVGGGVEVRGGPRRTVVTLSFNESADGADIAAHEMRRIREKGRRFLNYFLNTFRHFFRDERIYPLSPAEFYEIRQNHAVRIKISVVDEQGHGRHLIGTAFGDETPLELRAVGPVKESEVERFRGVLLKGDQPPLPDLLLLNANRLLHEGDYRLCVIEASTALDVAVEEVGLRVLVNERRQRADAVEELKRASTKKVAESIIQPRIDRDLVNSSVWKRFMSEHRLLRNRVVHDAYDPSKEQAEDFVSTVEGIVDFLFYTSPGRTA